MALALESSSKGRDNDMKRDSIDDTTARIVSHEFEPDDAIRCEQIILDALPAYRLYGHPDTLSEFVDGMYGLGVDTDFVRSNSMSSCVVWSDSVRGPYTHDDIAKHLRKASDSAGLDIVFVVASS